MRIGFTSSETPDNKLDVKASATRTQRQGVWFTYADYAYPWTARALFDELGALAASRFFGHSKEDLIVFYQYDTIYKSTVT